MLFPNVLVTNQNFRREMKGKQDLGGKIFPFSRYLKQQMNAGEDRARLRSLLLGEHLGMGKASGSRASASQPRTRKTFPSFQYCQATLCCSTAPALTYPHNPVYPGHPQEPGEAHRSCPEVCAVSQLGFITNNMPETIASPQPN